MPFPEAQDSLRFELPYADRTGARDSLGRPLFDPADPWALPPEPGRPPLGRPDQARQEAIRIQPRPREIPSLVRVLLTRSSRPIALYSLGEVEVRSDAPGSKPRTARGRLSVRRDGGEFEVTEGNRLALSASARRVRVLSLSPYNLLELGGQVYRGHIELIAEGNDLLAVNVLEVEDYLRGVLPYELGNVDRDGLEALKAQAVAARTYVYKRMAHNRSGHFHVYADVQDQVYRGVKAEYLLSDRAVRETRGMALTFGDSLAQCYYHSTCGGRTANRHEVWGGDSIGYLTTRPDLAPDGGNFCRASRYSGWRQEWTLGQLAGILRRNLASAGVASVPRFSAVTGLDVLSRAACGRVKVLRIQTDAGPILVKGDKVRWALRPAGAEEKILPSAWFEVKVAGGKALAEGRAFGHGIGLCQFGSIARSRAGQDFRTIMQAYYAGTELVEYR